MSIEYQKHKYKNKHVTFPLYFLYLIDIIINLISHINLCIKLFKKFGMEVNRKWSSGNKGGLFFSFCFVLLNIKEFRLKWIIQGEGEIDDNRGGTNTRKREGREKASCDGVQRRDSALTWGEYFLSLTPHKAGQRDKYASMLAISLVIRKRNLKIRVCNLCITSMKWFKWNKYNWWTIQA